MLKVSFSITTMNDYIVYGGHSILGCVITEPCSTVTGRWPRCHEAEGHSPELVQSKRGCKDLFHQDPLVKGIYQQILIRSKV